MLLLLFYAHRSLQVLYDMKVLAKINQTGPEASSKRKSSATEAPVLDDPLAYHHVSVKTVPRDSSGATQVNTGDDSAIKNYRQAMAKVVALRRDTIELSASKMKMKGNLAPFTSMRGMRRDKEARSVAALALLNETTPPKEMRMGLGWACLHVDVVVYTEKEEHTEPMRVVGHIQWCHFWSTYQVRLTPSGFCLCVCWGFSLT